MNSALLQTFNQGFSIDMRAFAPELWICFSIVFMLLIRLAPRYDKLHLGKVAVFLSAIALLISLLQWPMGVDWKSVFAFLDSDNVDSGLPSQVGGFLDSFDPHRDPRHESKLPMDLFGGMLVFDSFAVFLKIFLYSFITLVAVLTLLTRIPDKEDSADFYCLLFGSTLGMSIMASSNHLLMVFIGIEMASLPSYALAGFLKGRRQSSEAALKYVVYGGGASGVMLYGISLLAGRFGTGYLPDIVRQMSEGAVLAEPSVALGLTFLLLGIGFKLAAFPFHFWCPDVFEGASAEVGAFLSVASKGAALALLARIALGLGAMSGTPNRFADWSHAADYLVPVLAVFAVATTTFGNLAAFAQTNLKRLLAYSTIAHAGFMMMGLATMTREGAGAVLFYLAVYLFMNLGAFAVVAFMRNLTGQEDLSYYRGFVYRSPLLVITLGVFLMSLLGMPPLGGFQAKFQIFQVLYESAQGYEQAGKPHLSWTMYGLLLAAGLNTVISLFYYVKILKVMVLEKTLEEIENRPVETKPAPILQAIYATLLAMVVLALGIVWNPLAVASEQVGIDGFRAAPAEPKAKAPEAEKTPDVKDIPGGGLKKGKKGGP
jgi:NADH-quinone oxidoreductase subunit N